ncbi:MAG: DUF503 domain-containing protein [Anaerolineales bacterium]|jgi:uncharacterized protein YlxP (DUF503 family)
MHVASITVELRIPGSASLKSKRGRIKPLLNGLHRKFNISAAEIDHQDHHSLATVACVVVSNDARHAQRLLAKIPGWIETHRPDIQVLDHEIAMW